MNERTLVIKNGPDRMGLAVGLILGDNRQQLPAIFTVAEQDGSHEWVETIKINSIEREDGSGLSFNLKGHNIANGCKVRIYYNMRNRSGSMVFLKN